MWHAWDKKRMEVRGKETTRNTWTLGWRIILKNDRRERGYGVTDWIIVLISVNNATILI
jgi:hypothetical protein